ncbi:cupin domain-containing protein [Paenibacillus ferrarius]|uniref:cupin domain-containing protein n=1 Tax=Paenibacillus ferrarius TaxID=1469647 RepID=UPI0009A4DAAC
MHANESIQKGNLTSLHQNLLSDYENFVIGTVNESCLRLAVFTGTYPWHFHPDSDELFLVLEGELIIELHDKESIILAPNEYVTIPAGVLHRTRSKVRTVNLCFEHTDANTVFVEESNE